MLNLTYICNAKVTNLYKVKYIYVYKITVDLIGHKSYFILKYCMFGFLEVKSWRIIIYIYK